MRSIAGKGGGGEEEGGGVVASAARRDEHPAFVLLGLNLVGDEGEAELLSKGLVRIHVSVLPAGRGFPPVPSGRRWRPVRRKRRIGTVQAAGRRCTAISTSSSRSALGREGREDPATRVKEVGCPWFADLHTTVPDQTAI